MKQIHRVRIPKLIESLITERVTIIQEPFMYRIKGVAGGGCDNAYSAHSTWKKIKEWVEKNGAECSLIQDRYQEIAKKSLQEIDRFQEHWGQYPIAMNRKLQKGQSKGYLIAEITDPVSFVIDKILENTNSQKIS